MIKDHEFALSTKIMLHEQFDSCRNWQMVEEYTIIKNQKIMQNKAKQRNFQS